MKLIAFILPILALIWGILNPEQPLETVLLALMASFLPAIWLGLE